MEWSDKWQIKFNMSQCEKNNLKHKYSERKSYPREKELLKTTKLDEDVGVNVDPEQKIFKFTEIQVNKTNKMLRLIYRSYEYMDGEMLKNWFIA